MYFKRVTSPTPSRDNKHGAQTKMCRKSCTVRIGRNGGKHAPTSRDIQDHNDNRIQTCTPSDEENKDAAGRPRIILVLNSQRPARSSTCQATKAYVRSRRCACRWSKCSPSSRRRASPAPPSHLACTSPAPHLHLTCISSASPCLSAAAYLRHHRISPDLRQVHEGVRAVKQELALCPVADLEDDLASDATAPPPELSADEQAREHLARMSP